MKELQSLCLDVSALDQDGLAIDIKESVDEEGLEEFKIESVIPDDIGDTHMIEEVDVDEFDENEDDMFNDEEIDNGMDEEMDEFIEDDYDDYDEEF